MKYSNLEYITPPCTFPNIVRKSKFSNENDAAPSGHTNVLYIYFLFSYYVGFTPFRFSFDKVQRVITLTSWMPQKIFCAVVHVLVLIRYGVEIRRVYQSIKPTDPVGFFRLIETTSSFLCKLIAFYYFWKKRDFFNRIVQYLENTELPEYNPYKIQSTLFVSSVCSFYLVTSVMNFLFDSLAVETVGWSAQSWLRHLVAEARYSYFLSPEINTPRIEHISTLDTFLSVVTAISILFRLVVGFYMDLCILFCILSLWTPVSGYCRIINEAIEPYRTGVQIHSQHLKLKFVNVNQNAVLEQFKALKHLSQLVSNAIGGFLLPAISEIAFGYALDFDNVIVSQDVVYQFKTILFYMSTFTTLLLAAEIGRKISCVKEWLSVHEDELTLSSNELMIVLHDISQNEMCVNAGGRFILNYSFVGTMVTVLVTFLIIRLQSEVMASQPSTGEIKR